MHPSMSVACVFLRRRRRQAGVQAARIATVGSSVVQMTVSTMESASYAYQIAIYSADLATDCLHVISSDLVRSNLSRTASLATLHVLVLYSHAISQCFQTKHLRGVEQSSQCEYQAHSREFLYPLQTCSGELISRAHGEQNVGQYDGNLDSVIEKAKIVAVPSRLRSPELRKWDAKDSRSNHDTDAPKNHEEDNHFDLRSEW